MTENMISTNKGLVELYGLTEWGLEMVKNTLTNLMVLK